MSRVESPMMMSPTVTASPTTAAVGDKPAFFASLWQSALAKFRSSSFSPSSRTRKLTDAELMSMNGFQFRVVGVRNYRVMQKEELCVPSTSLRSLCTMRSNLSSDSTVADLCSHLRSFFGLPSNCELLILFSHHVISEHPSERLSAFGVCDLSLLTVALCDLEASSEADKREKEEKEQQKEEKEQQKEEEEEKKKKSPLPREFELESHTGLDVVTQEESKLYKMPGCGHCMSKQSLLGYCRREMESGHQVRLKCPHVVERKEEKRDDEGETGRQRQQGMNICGHMWDYAQVKKVLSAEDGEPLVEQVFISKEKKALLVNYYDLQHTYYALLHDKMPVREPFKQRMREAENQFPRGFGFTCEEVCRRAKTDAENQEWNAPSFECTKVHKLDGVLARLELHSSRNMLKHNFDVQVCPTCDTVHYRPEGVSSRCGMSHAKCQRCHKEAHFCWKCGKPGKEPHFCRHAFQEEILQVLREAPTKKIGPIEGVPSVRACPNCAQLIFHVEACKHMKCAQGCKQSFCFVCLKPKLNGNWQCGCSSDPCPLAPVQTQEMLPQSDKLKQSQFELL